MALEDFRKKGFHAKGAKENPRKGRRGKPAEIRFIFTPRTQRKATQRKFFTQRTQRKTRAKDAKGKLFHAKGAEEKPRKERKGEAAFRNKEINFYFFA